MLKRGLSILVFTVGFALTVAAVEVTITADTNVISLYEKLEIGVKGDFAYTNPYDYNEVNVKAYFQLSKAMPIAVDGFYSEDYIYNETEDVLKEQHTGGFKIRFAPRKAGVWKYQVAVFKKGLEVYRSGWGKFTANTDIGHGFVTVSDKDELFFERQNSGSFFSVGVNLPAKAQNGMKEYKDIFDSLDEENANTFRLILGPDGFDPQWGRGNLYNYRATQRQAALFDVLLKELKVRGMEMILVLGAKDNFAIKYRDENPYLLSGGGMLKEAGSFFTEKEALAAYKNKIRYILARWGYSPEIMAWELFDEADRLGIYEANAVIAWHKEISEFIKKNDAHKHLVTTSFFDPYKEEQVWELKSIDMTQTHMFNQKDEADEIYDISRYKLEKFSKPHIITAYGIDEDGTFIEKGLDKEGVSVHNSIWSGGLSMSAGTPMPWYWEKYINKYWLYQQYKPFTEYMRSVNLVKGTYFELRNRDVFYSNDNDKSPSSVVIYPADIFGTKPPVSKFAIRQTGKTDNKRFLFANIYGTGYEQYKNDPVLILRNEDPIKLTVKLKAVEGENYFFMVLNTRDTLGVSLSAKNMRDNRYTFDTGKITAPCAESYTIDIPAGENQIMLSNRGTGYVKIDSIIVSDYANPRLAPVFVSGIQSAKSARVWLKNKNYRWDNPNPEPIKNFEMTVTDLLEGRYTVSTYNTETGEYIKQYEDITETGDLLLEIKDLKRDMAVTIEKYSVPRGKGKTK